MTGLDVKPLPGTDVLQRRGDVVILVATAGGDDATVDSLLDLARVAGEEAIDGRTLVRRLARLLTEDDDAVLPALVAVAPSGTGVAVLVHGDAEVVVTDAAGSSETLSGKTAATWIDRIIEWPAASLVAVTSAATSDAPIPRSELHDGVVGAGGFLVVPSGVAAPIVAAAPVVDTAPDEIDLVAADLTSTEAMPLPEPVLAEPPSDIPVFDSVLLLGGATEEPREPLPVAGDDGHQHDVIDADAVIVKGIMCKRDHFNTPKAAFCGVCGISMVQQTHQLVDGPRPPLGVIVLDDGVTFGLDADYVIGREPENDADVMAGRVRGLPIDDPDGSVSRVHALIKLDEWDVLIVDRDSANGTRVAPPGTDAWTSLTPHDPVLIVPGTKVQLGARVFVFDAHNL